MIKGKRVYGTITIVVRYAESVSSSMDDNDVAKYIEENAYDYLMEADKDNIRVLDVEIEDEYIDEWEGEEEYEYEGEQ